MPAKKTVKKGAKKSVKKVVAKPKKAPSKKASASAKKATAKQKKVVSAKKPTAKPKKTAAAKKSKSKPAKVVSKSKKLGATKKPATRQKRAPKRAPILESAPSVEPIELQEPEFVDVGRFETEIYEPDPEVKQEFAEAAVLGDSVLMSRFENFGQSAPEPPPPQSATTTDTGWDQNDAVGEEAVGGENPTPDQDIVDELGQQVGLSYQDNEPLDTAGKLAERDEHRWELEPQSSEDFDERSKRQNDQ